MIPQLTSIDPAAAAAHIKNILVKDGFQCSIIELESGEETPRREPPEVEQHVIFAIEGEVTVRHGDLNTVLKKDEAILLPKATGYQIAAGATHGAKILRVDVPPRQVIAPQLLTVER